MSQVNIWQYKPQAKIEQRKRIGLKSQYKSFRQFLKNGSFILLKTIHNKV
jgi:ribosomal protein L23